MDTSGKMLPEPEDKGTADDAGVFDEAARL
jgi:hypothetical protein